MTMPKYGKATRALSAAATPLPKRKPLVVQPVQTASPYKHMSCYSKSSDITIAEGRGCWIWDTHGKKYLDVTSGIAVLSTGHCHPRVVEAVQQQAGRVMHAQLNCFESHQQLDALMDKLGRIAPEGMTRFVVDTTGTQAIEAAVKLARRHTNRANVVCLAGGFHGRSALTSAMTSSNAGARFPVATPLPSGVYHVDPPLAFAWGVSEEEAVERAWKGFVDLFNSKVPKQEVAAVLFEPVLGEGGFVPIAPEFAQRVSKFCKENGILVISDEVQAGMGRTGEMWGCSHFGGDYAADIFITAKGIASGMPLSVVGAREEVAECYTPGTHGGTYMGNAVACAAANATLDVIEEEGLVDNARQQGQVLKSTLEELQKAYLPACDVRGMGLMVGMELCTEDGQPSPELARHIRAECLERGVLLYAPSGWYGNCLRVMPPLIVQDHEILQITSSIEHAFKSWKASRA